MNDPKVPSDNRNWNSMDIFLFSNGQQNTPPRKYHLKSDELKWWNSTLDYLARSQYGSMQSNIQLYTLDGKKIDSPLDLTNGAAYVMVKSPEKFIQTGYEKYLLKASRSREKRQERLSSNETAKPENIETSKEQWKSNFMFPNDTFNTDKEHDDGISLETNIEYLATVLSNNTLTQSRKDTESLQEVEAINNNVKSGNVDLLQTKKPGNGTKSTILKRIYPNSKSKDEVPNMNKKRNTSFPKNLIKSSSNVKKLTKSSNNATILKTNLGDKVELKEKPQCNIANKSFENSTEIKNTAPNSMIIGSSEKDLTVFSDVYKNTESDVQSVYIDADRKTALLSNENRKMSPTLDNVEEFAAEEELPKTTSKTKKEISRESAVVLSATQTPDSINQPGTFNLNLTIDLKGCTLHKTQEKNQESQWKSYKTLMKSEKASQINVDLNLSSDNLNFGDYIGQGRSLESSNVKMQEENVDSTNIKVIIFDCRCNLSKTDTIKPSGLNVTENDNHIFLLPTEINSKSIHRNDLETPRASVKDNQEYLHSCIRVPVTSNSDVSSNKKSESIAKHKVSISQEAPTELNYDNIQSKSRGDMPSLIKNDHNRTIYKIDTFTQTDWCNVLLQAKCQEDGRCTFRLPPLHLLTQYKLL